MLIFDKYIDKELNVFSSLYLMLKLKCNRQFRRKLEQYTITSNNLKQMFIINEAEKEIKKYNNLNNFDFLVNQYITGRSKDKDIVSLLDNAFSN